MQAERLINKLKRLFYKLYLPKEDQIILLGKVVGDLYDFVINKFSGHIQIATQGKYLFLLNTLEVPEIAIYLDVLGKQATLIKNKNTIDFLVGTRVKNYLEQQNFYVHYTQDNIIYERGYYAIGEENILKLERLALQELGKERK